MCEEPFCPPHGIAEIRRVYGDILVERGQVIHPIGWEATSMITVADFPGCPNRLHVHRLIVEPLRVALSRCLALADGYKVRTIGCFNPRPKRGGGTALSLHSWGVAVDINADQNPRGNPMKRDIPDAWVAIFRDGGWTWGGDFPTSDPMHFQLAGGY